MPVKSQKSKAVEAKMVRASWWPSAEPHATSELTSKMDSSGGSDADH